MLATWTRRLPAIAVGVPIVFVVSWVLFFATGTSSGSAVSEPGEFVITLLDGITFAGLMFVVASGFTLDLRVDAHGQHGPRLAVPPRRLHRHRVAAEDGRQVTQPRTGGRQRDLLGRADVRRCRYRGSPRRRHPAGVPPLEPGSGPSSGADHGRDLGDHGRSDAGALRWSRPADDLARRRHALLRDLRPALRDQSVVHARGRAARRCAAVAVAEQDADGPRHPGRRRRPRRWCERWASTSPSCSP